MTGAALICDGSSADLMSMKNVIEGIGYLASIAIDGSETIEKAKKEQPDIIFLDISMPQMNGYETCRRLTDDLQTRHIPVILVSRKNRNTDRIWGYMQGGKDLITKPVRDVDIINHQQQYVSAHSTALHYADFRCSP